MEEWILNQLANINAGNLMTMSMIAWFFYSRLKQEIKDMKVDLKKDVDLVHQDVKYIKEHVQNVDKRLCHLEGVLEQKQRYEQYQPKRYK